MKLSSPCNNNFHHRGHNFQRVHDKMTWLMSAKIELSFFTHILLFTKSNRALLIYLSIQDILPQIKHKTNKQTNKYNQSGLWLLHFWLPCSSLLKVSWCRLLRERSRLSSATGCVREWGFVLSSFPPSYSVSCTKFVWSDLHLCWESLDIL